MSLTVQHNQTMVDIAMQATGQAELAWQIAMDNDRILTDDLTTGETIATPTATPQNQRVVALLNRPNLWPASGEATGPQLLDGLDYWFIDDDFIIT